MCGRITQKSDPQRLGLGLTTTNLIERLQAPPRYNGAPGQDHWVIRQNPKTGERSLDRLWWGLEPDPRDLLVPFPSEPMAMWPISTRVNKPENDDAVILDRIEAAAQP
jgi:putative SOS response-associated peptidase YedK